MLLFLLTINIYLHVTFGFAGNFCFPPRELEHSRGLKPIQCLPGKGNNEDETEDKSRKSRSGSEPDVVNWFIRKAAIMGPFPFWLHFEGRFFDP